MSLQSIRPVLLRLVRAGLLLFTFGLIHWQAQWREAERRNPISLRQAQKFFISAHRVQLRDPERGLFLVTDARGNTLGALLRTSPFTDQIIGYAGPNDVLVALDPQGAVAGLELLRSGDTPEHVRRVRDTPGFLRRFIGWKPNLAAPPKADAVSGATLTSFAVAESIEKRLAGAAPSLRFPEPLALADIQVLFTNATRFVQEKSRWRVLDAGQRTLGFVVRTSPQSDNVPGYRGPTDSLLALTPDGQTVRGISLRKTYDTESYVDQVRRSEAFARLFISRRVGELAAMEYPRERLDGVSGATITARAVAEGVKRRFATTNPLDVVARPWRPQTRDIALGVVVSGALMMSFSPLRGRRWLRWVWQILLVGYVGLVNHDFVSLALLGGWAAGGVALKAAPGLVLLVAASFLVPWGTRRQIYCHHICPHGAAQQLLGQLGGALRRHRDYRASQALSMRGERGFQPQTSTRANAAPGRRCWSRVGSALESIPGVLLAIALLALLLGWNLSLASLEAFDAWVWQTAGIATLTFAGLGLAAAPFVSQPYCRFGCPTGALLNFVRATGAGDRWRGRDWTAVALLLGGAAAAWGARSWSALEPEPPPLEMRGRTMGTTWSIKIRDEVADSPALKKVIAREFEWAESMTSHSRTNTDLSEFNRTPSTQAIPVPWPIITLSRWGAEISQATGGAYDLTVGPLARLWGFGPGPRRTEPPSEAEIQAVRAAAGWKNLVAEEGQLRKMVPSLEVDLSSIAKGWAIDQITQVLARRGYTNVLVEAGGDSRASGRWTIAIEHPARSCILLNESVASSGAYPKNLVTGTRQDPHLIDPRTGRPITHRTVAVSVRHADCAHAQAWAAAFNVLGAESGMPLADRLHLAVQFVTKPSPGQFQLQESLAWKERSAGRSL